jgi:ABC-type glycerol-3-phosphate transport system permease component
MYGLLLVFGVIFLAPLAWMLSTSLKTNEQLIVYPPVWIPDPIRFANYPEAWAYAPFGTYLVNSTIITLVPMVGMIVSTTVVAYAFARLDFPGRGFLFVCVLSMLMVPDIVTMIPAYILFRHLGWINTFYPLIVPAFFGGGAGGAFFIFLMRQFFRTIPMELSDAARIDGAGELGILFRVILPLSGPVFATVSIFSFQNYWNDYMGPLIYISSADKLPLTLGIQTLTQSYTGAIQYQYLMAVSLLMSLPVIVIFFTLQRHFVRGIVLTGLQG